jgi:hypothetical protein
MSQGRFGRMFRNLPVFSTDASDLLALGESMIQPVEDDKPDGQPDSDENPNIPAGYTYLGQFIDHDITFDPVSSLQRQNDPEALVDFRTPRFDLDNLYGRGPADQPYLYEADGIRLLLGDRVSDEDSIAGPDLQRNAIGRALIGDPRNDENLIVSQLQSVFIRFHNTVAEKVQSDTGLTGDDLMKETQRLVRWHYQWVVIHDFLPRVTGGSMDVGRALVSDILGPTPYAAGGAQASQGTHVRAKLLFYTYHNQPFMPVEFSVAAYRFGHSMIRPSYLINDFVKEQLLGQTPPPFRTRIFSDSADPLANLNGFRRLPQQWGFQWKYFFNLTDAQKPQNSYKIDTTISNPLNTLPGPAQDGITRSLPQRNLLRGLRIGLPAGQDVARAIGIAPITGADVNLPAGLNADLAVRTPLWYYVLREAELLGDSTCLGPVGGRIVAEVLIGLLAGDPLSYLSVQPTWQPQAPLANAAGEFGMPELIKFAVPTATT